MPYPCPYCSTVGTHRNNLRTHLTGARIRGGHELGRPEADEILERVERMIPIPAAVPAAAHGRPSVVRRAPVPATEPGTAAPVRAGHETSLALLEQTLDVRATLRAYEQATGHPVYLRPTDRGLTVIGLDPSLPAMVGVGGGDDVYLTSVPPSADAVAGAVRGYQAKVAAMRRSSTEERFVLAAIARALRNGLRLDSDGLLFLHQEWRFGTSSRLDVLALDSTCGQIVVIEAKDSATAARRRDGFGRTAAEQAAYYARLVFQHAGTLYPFFGRLARALLHVYGDEAAPTVALDPRLPPRWEVWWPGGRVGGTAVAATAAAVPSAPSAAARQHAITDDSWVASDAPWQRDLRVRQSQWRAARGYPIGTHNGRPLGSRLRMPDAEEHLWNYLTPGIGRLVREEFLANAKRPRSQKKMYGYPRLFEDLLSSQPLAFNLFGELSIDLGKATAVARRLWPGRVDQVTAVEFEWSPGRWDARYLDNGTAADVALLHTTPRGGIGIVFVETKYHEDLLGKDNAIKPRYVEVARASGAFVAGAERQLESGNLQQIWLDHLLALATRQAARLETVLFTLVYPEINVRCQEADRAYAATLTPLGRETFAGRPLESVVAAVEETLRDEWVRAFTARYLGTAGA